MKPALALVVVWAVATTVGPTAIDLPSDLPIYRAYAEALGQGLVPYRDFAVEYPPLALVPMALAGLLGADGPAYEVLFALLMLTAALVAQAAAARLAGPERAKAAAWGMVLLPVAIGAVVRTRFDLLPTALALAGLAGVLARRPVLGFGLLGAGAATKLFPALPAAAALAWLLAGGRRGEARAGAAAFAAVIVVSCLPFVIASPAGFLEQFEFHVERPVQIESTPGSVLWAFGDAEVTGAPKEPDRFKSNGLTGGPVGPVTAIFALLELAAVAAAVALAARRPGDDRHLVLAAFTAVLAFVTLGKVLSPQYMIWLAPLAIVAGLHGARAPAALVLLALPLTQLEFPSRYFDLVDGENGVVALVGLRNLVLLVALSLALAQLARRARSPVPAASPPAHSG